MKINLKLLPLKSHYFLFNAGIGPFVPFVPTLIKQLGFSSLVTGIVYTILPISAVIARPIVGAIADKFHCQKSLFISFIFLTLLSYYMVLWIPPLPRRGEGELHCYKLSNMRICTGKLSDKEILNSLRSIKEKVVCQVSCTAEEELLEAVCKTWHQPQYCATRRGGTHRLESLVAAHMNLTTSPSPPPHIVSNSPQTLHFKAHLLPSHSLQDDHEPCVFIRLGDVQFVPPDWSVAYCDKLAVAPCQLNCNSTLINEIATNVEVDDNEVSSIYQFWLLLLCLIVGWDSMAIVVSVGDTICFEMLGGEPSKYGYQRLWGSVGWGLFSFIAGYLVDVCSEGHISKDYTPALYMMIILLGLNMMAAWKLKFTQSKRSPSILQDISTILSNIRMFVFLLWCVIVGVYTAFVWNFLFWYLEDLAQARGDLSSGNRMKTLEGLVMVVQCFGGELPFFFLSGWVLKKLGHVKSMSVVLLALGVRFILYSFLSDPWWALPIELLNGLTFGLFYATMATYASIVAPPGTETTCQGLVGAIFEGVGVSIGSFIAGVSLKHFSGRVIFRSLGIFGVVISAVHFLAQYLIDKFSLPLGESKGFRQPKYANPNDAMHMLEDNTSFTPS